MSVTLVIEWYFILIPRFDGLDIENSNPTVCGQLCVWAWYNLLLKQKRVWNRAEQHSIRPQRLRLRRFIYYFFFRSTFDSLFLLAARKLSVFCLRRNKIYSRCNRLAWLCKVSIGIGYWLLWLVREEPIRALCIWLGNILYLRCY